MELYDMNCIYLKQRYPSIYQCLRSRMEEYEIFIGDAVNGEQFLSIQKNSLTLLGSMYDPGYAVHRYLCSFEKGKRHSILLFGFGDGRVLRGLLDMPDLVENCWVYEPSLDVLDRALQVFDLSDILKDDRFHLYVPGINLIDLENAICDSLRDDNWRMFSIHALPEYDMVFSEEWTDCESIYERCRSAKEVTELELLRFAEIGLYNDIHSLRWMLRARVLGQLRNPVWEDIPCILVAAGPSLEKNVDWLREAKGKACIICVDTAVRYLLKHGILPDFIGTIDGDKESLGIDTARLAGVPVLASTDSNYRLVESLERNDLIYVDTSTDWFRRLMAMEGAELPELESCPSVAAVCFQVAIKMGFRTIILIGQDLSYSGTHTHAGVEHDTVAESDRRYEVEGYYGGVVQSNHGLWLCRNWYNRATVHLGSEYTVINATEGGARIQNTIQMPLKEAIARYCNQTVDCSRILEGIQEVWSDYQKKKEFYYMLKDKLQEFRVVYQDTEEGLAAVHNILSMVQEKGIDLEEYHRNEQMILSLLSRITAQDIYEILAKHSIRSYLKMGRQEASDGSNKDNSAERIFLPIRDHLAELHESVEKALPIWKEVLGRINADYQFE